MLVLLPVTPLTLMPPTTLPPTMIGNPPGEANTPGNDSVAGALLIASMKARVGRRYIAAAFALPTVIPDAAGLRVVHALEIDEEAVLIHDRDRDIPLVLGAFGEHGGCDFLGAGGVDRGCRNRVPWSAPKRPWQTRRALQQSEFFSYLFLPKGTNWDRDHYTLWTPASMYDCLRS